tara:strand:- start:675308 stop:676546 length:1239 start_codon:yes stop_codon:yes gene_type:complete
MATNNTQSGERNTLMLHHLVWRGLVAIVLVGVLGYAAYYLTSDHHSPAPHQVMAPGGAFPVNSIVIEPKDIPLSPRFLAQTLPSAIVPLRARVSGYLMSQNFEEGQVVKEGELLFTIDPKPFKVALRQAEAGLHASEAQLTRATQQVERFKNLAELQQAAANELEQAQESQRIASASVETQRAYIEQAKLDLDYTTIESPITGVIGLRNQDVGSYVGMNTESLLATVQKVDPLYVQYSVSEQDLLRWQRMTDSGELTDVPVEQLDVHVILPDGGEFPYLGRINFVDIAVDPSTGTAVIRASVPNPDRTLRPGQFVHAEISGITRLNAITVPQSAVMHTPTGAAVYVVDAESLAQMRPITLGDWVGADWVIESGLESGDQVIVNHLMQVRPGMEVSSSNVDSDNESTTGNDHE